jgi:hypothetical protein
MSPEAEGKILELLYRLDSRVEWCAGFCLATHHEAITSGIMVCADTGSHSLQFVLTFCRLEQTVTAAIRSSGQHSGNLQPGLQGCENHAACPAQDSLSFESHDAFGRSQMCIAGRCNADQVANLSSLSRKENTVHRASSGGPVAEGLHQPTRSKVLCTLF